MNINLKYSTNSKVLVKNRVLDSEKPIKTSVQRIVIIDILRGFALFGVLITHLFFSFSGWSYLSDEVAASLPFSHFDNFLKESVKFFFSNKFRGIFSFLFGLSFSLQMASTIKKGLPYKKIFIKRMAILLMFGLFHAYFIWHGDILRWYVIAGLVLLCVHNWSSKKLLFAGIFLSTIIPVLNSWLKMITGNLSYEVISHGEYFNAIAGNSLSNLLVTNFLYDFEHNFDLYYRISFVLVILGQFMLGLWAGKNDIFKKYIIYKTAFKKVFLLGLFLGLGGTGMVFLLSKLSAAEVISLPRIMDFALELPESFGVFGLSLAYISGITLLHDKTYWKNKLSIFIPVGRMALTNYIMQSVICIIIFYGIGFGLIGKLSLIYLIPIGLLIFSFQIIFSAWWLKHFHSGPLEWVWRTLMLGKKQPFLI